MFLKKMTFLFLGMTQGNVSEWDQLWKLFLNEQEPQEKIKLMFALTAPKDPEILSR